MKDKIYLISVLIFTIIVSQGSAISFSADGDISFLIRMIDVALDESATQSTNDNLANSWIQEESSLRHIPEGCSLDSSSNNDIECIVWRDLKCDDISKCNKISEDVYRWEDPTYRWKTGRYVAQVSVGYGTSAQFSKTKPQFVLWNPDSTVVMTYDKSTNTIDVTVNDLVHRLSCHGYDTLNDYDRKVCNEEEHMGGKVHVTFLAARNIPDLDGFGASGGYSDPKVRVTMPHQDPYFSQDSQVIANCEPGPKGCASTSSNRISLGRKFSGSIIHFDVWDNDVFFEGLDDYVGRAKANVIFCSKLKTRTLDVVNPTNSRNLFVDDATFQNEIPTSSLLSSCVEEAWIPITTSDEQDTTWQDTSLQAGDILNPCFELKPVYMNCDHYSTDFAQAQSNAGEFSFCNDTTTSSETGESICACYSSWVPSEKPCIKIRIEMEPFDLSIEQYNGQSETQPSITVAPLAGDIPQPYSVYAPYIGNDSPMQVDQKGLNDGSLCIQTFQDDYINTRQIYISFITNFHADVYVYRKYTDLYSLEGGAFETLKSNTMPPWLCGGDMSQGEDDTTTSSVVMDTSRYDVCNANTDAGTSSTMGLKGDWIELAGDWTLGKFNPPQSALIVGTGIGGTSTVESNYYAFMNTFVGGQTVSLGGSMYGRDPSVAVTNNQFIILVKMLASVETSPETHEFSYKDLGVESEDAKADERSRFIALIFFFILCFLLTLTATWIFASKLHYDLSDTAIASALFSLRLDKESHLSSSKLTKDKLHLHILGSLWVTYDNDEEDPSNVLTRRNIFFAVNTMRLLFTVPWLLWIAVGGVLVFRVNPALVGIIWNTIGLAIWLVLFGGLKWRAQGYRMNATVLGMFTSAIALVIIFIYLAVIFDPLRFSRGLDFTATAVIFVTTNVVIMSWMVFLNHHKLRKAYEDLNKISGDRDQIMSEIMGVLDMDDNDEEGSMKKKKHQGLNVFIESVYTIDSRDPMFWLSDPLADTLHSHTESDNNGKFLFVLAHCALGILYIVSSYANDFAEKQSSQAQLVLQGENVEDLNEANQSLMLWFNIIIFDISLLLLRRGDFSWDPGYEAFVMTMGRFALVLFIGEYWLVGHALGHFIFTIAVAREIVDQRFPHHTDDRVAGAIAYFGRIVRPTSEQINDISGHPEFVMGFLFFFNMATILISSYNEENPPKFDFFGSEWSSITFAILIICVSLMYSLTLCASRSSMLEKHDLLNSSRYFAFSNFTVPAVFGMGAWLVIFCSGILVSVITKSNLFWELGLFLPMIMASASEFWKCYTLNDCNVFEPPEKRVPDKETSKKITNDDDEEEENKKQKNKTFVLPSLTDVKDFVGSNTADLGLPSFALPPLIKNAADSIGKGTYNITMPSLPIRMPTSLGGGEKKKKKNKSTSAVVPEEEEETTSSKKEETSSKEEEEEVEEEKKKTNDESTKEEDKSAPPTKKSSILVKFKSFFTRCGCVRSRKVTPANEKNNDKIDPEDPTKMSAMEAFMKGHLTKRDYYTLFCGYFTLVLTIIFGIFIATFEEPAWLGHVIWMSIFVFIFTALPIFEWFNTYRVDGDMVGMMIVAGIGLLTLAIFIFVAALDSDVNRQECILVLVLLYWYPTGWLMFYAVYKWKDDNWIMSNQIKRIFQFGCASIVLWLPFVHMWVQFALTKVEYPSVACEQLETLSREFGGAPDCSEIGLSDIDLSPLNEISKDSIGLLASVSLYLLTGLTLFVFYVLKLWSENDFYVPRRIQTISRVLVIVFVSLILFLGTIAGVNIVFCLSMGLLVLTVYAFTKYMGVIATHSAQHDPIFISQYVFPVYAYNVARDELIDITAAYSMAYLAMFVVLIWGAGLAAFVDPVTIGITVISFDVVAIVMFSAHLVSKTPIELGEATKCCDDIVFDTAASHAMRRYHSRRSKFMFHFDEADKAAKMRQNADAMLAKFQVKDSSNDSSEKEDETVPRQNAMAHASAMTQSQWHLYYSGETPQLESHYRNSSKSETKKTTWRCFILSSLASIVSGLIIHAIVKAIRDSSSSNYTPGMVGGLFVGLLVSYAFYVFTKSGWDALGALLAALLISYFVSFTLIVIALESFVEIVVAVSFAYITFLIVKSKTSNQGKNFETRLSHEFFEIWKSCVWQNMFWFGTGMCFLVITNGNDFIGLFLFFFLLCMFVLGLAADGDEMPLDLLLDHVENHSSDLESFENMKTRRIEALFTWPSALSEGFQHGVGPFAWIGQFGLLHHVTRFIRNLFNICHGRMKDADADGDGKVSMQEVKGLFKNLVTDAKTASKKMVREISQAKNRRKTMGKEKNHNILKALEQYMIHRPLLAMEFVEEIETMVLFQLLVLLAADEKVKAEQVVFQKFMGEYRFKLLANGIKPPNEIFESKSHATVDVNVVASWISRLSDEKREKFFSLKKKFTHSRNDMIKTQEANDEEWKQAADDLISYHEHRYYEMAVQHYELLKLHREQRSERGEKLDPSRSEHEQVAMEILGRIEEESKSGMSSLCRTGAFGRESQFHDPDFPHDHNSLGNCEGAYAVTDWVVSKGINQDCVLYHEGTDPDDVFQGELYNSWLLSAMSILAASGGIGDNDVDVLVDRLFVNKNTEVGAYAVQLFFNGQWEIIVVDDFFPVKADKTGRSGGAAFSHSKKMNELWVPLLEKAFAKYYGSYAELEQGFTEHALTALTGCYSEVIYLSQASRGTNKVSLWSKFLKYFNNNFLIGAATVSPDLASREIMDSGLVLGATYTVYEVRDVFGLHLVKLRNPPDYGEEGSMEWNGDWSDNSDLWTAKIKNRLKHTNDSNDGTFWMSFDDLCTSFRCLYVCHYYDPRKWKTKTFQACWSVESGTAQGVPSFHNKACDMKKLPHWLLKVNRPTDFIVDLTQSENGMATLIEPPLPMALYVVRVAKPMFIEKLTNENVMASSGDFVRSRKVTINTNLLPGTYILIAATYLKGDESPIELKVHSNFDVEMSQLTEIPEELHMKLANKAFEKAKMIQKQIEERARLELAKQGIGKKQIDQVTNALTSGMQIVDDTETSKMMETETSKPQVWSEEIDPSSGQIYYFNSETGEAVWDQPVDYDPQAAAEEKRLKAEKKREKKRRKCRICGRSKPNGVKAKQHPQWCQYGHTIGDVVKCEGGCNTFYHPVCVGFTDENCTMRWPSFTCTLCEGS